MTGILARQGLNIDGLSSAIWYRWAVDTMFDGNLVSSTIQASAGPVPKFLALAGSPRCRLSCSHVSIPIP
jgi:hypothetical protein